MAEGGGLLNRYRVVKPYRGFKSLRLRHFLHITYRTPLRRTAPPHPATIAYRDCHNAGASRLGESIFAKTHNSPARPRLPVAVVLRRRTPGEHIAEMPYWRVVSLKACRRDVVRPNMTPGWPRARRKRRGQRPVSPTAINPRSIHPRPIRRDNAVRPRLSSLQTRWPIIVPVQLTRLYCPRRPLAKRLRAFTRPIVAGFTGVAHPAETDQCPDAFFRVQMAPQPGSGSLMT